MSQPWTIVHDASSLYSRKAHLYSLAPPLWGQDTLAPHAVQVGVHAGPSVGTVVVILSIYKEESKVNRLMVTPGYIIAFEIAQVAVPGDTFCNWARRYASISFTIPSSTGNHLIFGSDSLNQLACLRTKIRVTCLTSAFACSSLNSPLTTLMHSRYPMADMVGREGE